jgi:hypothetical protein
MGWGSVENKAAFIALLHVLHAARLFGCSGIHLFFEASPAVIDEHRPLAVQLPVV